MIELNKTIEMSKYLATVRHWYPEDMVCPFVVIRIWKSSEEKKKKFNRMWVKYEIFSTFRKYTDSTIKMSEILSEGLQHNCNQNKLAIFIWNK